MSSMSVVHVAVAVIVDKDDQVLIAKRAKNQHQGDKWEFPGGKVEDGETSQEALRREVLEEIGLEVKSATFLIEISHTYDDKTVKLDVYRVDDWNGEAQGREGQPLQWVEKSQLCNLDFPVANKEIINILST